MFQFIYAINKKMMEKKFKRYIKKTAEWKTEANLSVFVINTRLLLSFWMRIFMYMYKNGFGQQKTHKFQCTHNSVFVKINLKSYAELEQEGRPCSICGLLLLYTKGCILSCIFDFVSFVQFLFFGHKKTTTTMQSTLYFSLVKTK